MSLVGIEHVAPIQLAGFPRRRATSTQATPRAQWPLTSIRDVASNVSNAQEADVAGRFGERGQIDPLLSFPISPQRADTTTKRVGATGERRQ